MVVLVLGVYNLISFNASTSGRIANSIAGAFDSRAEPVRNCIIQIVIGSICSVVGFVLYEKKLSSLQAAL